MPIKNLMYRVASLHPADLEGVEHLGADEAATIRKVIKVEVSGNQIFVDLNPTPREGEAILRRHPDSPVLKAILNKYGFVSPSVIIIEDYIDFFMVRYGASHPEENVREGSWAEKAFHILLQTIHLPVNYPEPTRDWRRLQPVDFYVPCVGAIDVKSVNLQWSSVNIPTHDFYKKPDYFIALRRIPSTKYVLIVGMMLAADVKTLCTDARGQWNLNITVLTI